MKNKIFAISAITTALSVAVYIFWPESYKSCLERAAKSANGSGFIYKSLSDLCVTQPKEKTKIDKFLDGK